ncbi:recombinase family protein [Gordonia sp. SND2]|uniref:recombinase family protein n=1 Tax=Gordonia sp. SND2 TaxID=3388659 RepID=UPI00398B3C24
MTVAAAYLRVSKSDEDDDESLSLETQRRRIQALCTAREWEYGPEYIDDGVSATKTRGDDTQWSTMLNQVGSGAFDVIVARDLDRLLRTLEDLVRLIERKARIVTVDGEIDLTTADGEFRATMLAAVARFEIRRKSERAINANETRRLKGEPVLRAKILGFADDGVTPVPDEADAVKKAFEDFVTGKKITHIARDLNELGYRTSKNREWSNANIRSLLGNARYKGVLTKWEPDADKRKSTGSAVQDVTYPGSFEPIVSVDVFDAAQSKLRAPERRRAWGTEPRHLLSGLAYCGRCADDKTKVYTSYYQQRPRTLRSGEVRSYEPVRLYACLAHKHLARNAEAVEGYVVDEWVLPRLQRPDARDLFAPPAEQGIDLDAVRVERATMQERLDGLAALYADGILDADRVREQAAKLRGQLAELDALLAPRPKNPGLNLVQADDIAAAWADLDVARQRIILNELVTVTILPSKRGAKGFDKTLIQVTFRE